MSLAGELRRLNPDTNPWVYGDVQAAVGSVMRKDIEGDLDAPTDPIAAHGFQMLHVLRDKLDGVRPVHFSEGQKRAFSRAAHLLVHSVAELATQRRNIGLAYELQYLSSRTSMEQTIDRAVQDVAELHLDTSTTDHLLSVTGSQFPALTMVSGELSLHQMSLSTPDDIDGFNEGLFHAAASLGSIALHEEMDLGFGNFPPFPRPNGDS
nr:Unknown Function [uncultured bacterium]